MPLTYTCSLCNTPFKSLLIPRHQAAKEVGELMQTHIRDKHPKEFLEFIQTTVPQIQTLAMGIALVNIFVTFDNEDKVSIDEHSGHIDKLMDLLGFDEEVTLEKPEENTPTVDKEKPDPHKDFLNYSTK